MNIVHIVHGKANPNEHNGISRVVYYLNKHEKLSGNNSQIWALVDGVKKHESFQRDEYVQIEMFPRVNLLNANSKEGICNYIKKHKNEIDIIHFHLIWFYDKNIIAKKVKELEIPLIITTHGTYQIHQAYTGKRLLAKWMYELKYLQMADAIHIITRAEGTGLRKYGYEGPVFLGYNGIEKGEVPLKRRTDYFIEKEYKNKIKFGWVGVLRDDKNLPSLIEAVAMLPKEIQLQLVFILIGPDYKGNAKKYMQMAEKLGCRENFDWIGPLYGQDKYDAIESFDAYIMPSHFEVLSLAVPDALACKKPCIVSSGCGYNYLIQEYNFGVLTEPHPYDLCMTIIDFINKKSEWSQMGEEGYRCVQEQLNWESISKNIIAGYEEVISKYNKRK